MKIIQSWWFAGQVCVGMVVTENDTGNRKARIGVGKGNNEESDSQLIADYGFEISLVDLQDVIDTILRK